VASFDEIQRAVLEYARDYIRAQKSRGRSLRDIAAQLDVTHVWVKAIESDDAKGSKTAGSKVEHRLAEILHGGSIDALRRAALTVASGGTVVVESGGEKVELTRPTRSPTSASKIKRR
jgi:ribosome-binding protein aMBF1 (putative translation factor)